MTAVLKVLAVGDPAVDVYVEPRYNIIAKYENTKGINVRFDIIPWAEYYDTMIEAFEGKRDYDIVMVAGHLWSSDFVNKGWISEAKYPDDKEYDSGDILPIVMEEMKVDDRIFLYPSFCDGHIILYRKSLVEKILGRPLGKVITTDELIEAVKAVHGEEGMAGIALKAHPSEIFLDVLPYLRNEGIDAFDPVTHEPGFNNRHGLAGLEKYLSLRAYAPEDTGTYGNDEVRMAFQKRKVVFAVTWGGQLGVVMDNRCEDLYDVGFATFKTPWNVTWSFAINARSTKWEEANEFLAYLTTKNIDRIVGGYAGSPVRQSTYEADSCKHPWYAIHLEMIRDFAKPLPKMINTGTKLSHLYSEITEAFNNRKTAAQALSDAYTAIRKIDEGKGQL